MVLHLRLAEIQIVNVASLNIATDDGWNFSITGMVCLFSTPSRHSTISLYYTFERGSRKYATLRVTNPLVHL